MRFLRRLCGIRDERKSLLSETLEGVREVAPGMYVFPMTEPPLEKVLEVMDELIEAMPEHRKVLEKTRNNLIESYENKK